MKFMTIIIAAVAIAATGFAADANLMKYVSILDPVVSTNATSAAIDVSAYKGNSTIVVDWGISTATNYSGTVTITHATASDGTYATVTNLAGTAASIVKTGTGTNTLSTYQIDSARLRKYIKANVVQSGQTNAVGVIMVAPMKSE